MTVTIYSKVPCSSCEQAKMVLKSRGIEFEVKVLGQHYDMEFLMDELDRLGMLGFRTFPLIVQGDKGYTFNEITAIQ